jgi:hypothetical protein
MQGTLPFFPEGALGCVQEALEGQGSTLSDLGETALVDLFRPDYRDLLASAVTQDGQRRRTADAGRTTQHLLDVVCDCLGHVTRWDNINIRLHHKNN